MIIKFYTRPTGRSPVLAYIKGLDKVERADLLEAIEDIRKNGFNALGVRFRQIKGKLWEIKTFKQRIFYILLSYEEMMLLHAYKKQGNKLPTGERDIAIHRMKEILK